MNSILIIASEVSLKASALDVEYFRWLTNSVIVAALVTIVIVFWARRATAKMQMIPDGRQNLFEALVEGLYTMLEGIVGKQLIGRTFSFLATLFIFILVSNWFGLVPGVGSIGWGHGSSPWSVEITDPLLRPATADLNLTLGLALLSMILWFIWTLQEVGPGGFIMHIFAPKGGMTGIIGKLLIPIFIVIGFLELISIATRPVSLSLRLFGNIFAGENILSMMIGIGREFHLNDTLAFIVGLAASLPFYFLEVMVGLLQAFVFMLLVAVYIQLSTSHDEETH